MNKIYYLSTCSTCARIIKEIRDCSNLDYEMQDIKKNPISESDLELMYIQTKSFEALFNKRAQKYKQLSVDDRPLKDKDYKHLILSEYTFLKRPVIQIGDEFFIGNSKAVVALAINKFNHRK